MTDVPRIAYHEQLKIKLLTHQLLRRDQKKIKNQQLVTEHTEQSWPTELNDFRFISF